MLFGTCLILNDTTLAYVSVVSSGSHSDARHHRIGVILGRQPIHVGVLPLLLSLPSHFVPDASLFHHVLSMFLILLGRILVHIAWTPLFPPKILHFPL
jgi:hypothetical protein